MIKLKQISKEEFLKELSSLHEIPTLVEYKLLEDSELAYFIAVYRGHDKRLIKGVRAYIDKKGNIGGEGSLIDKESNIIIPVKAWEDENGNILKIREKEPEKIIQKILRIYLKGGYKVGNRILKLKGVPFLKPRKVLYFRVNGQLS